MSIRPSSPWIRAAAALALGCLLPLAAATGEQALAASGSPARPATRDAGASPDRHRHEPLIIAHRAGTADYPENTLEGIRGSLDDGADGLWLTVQLSKDGVPVLYRPVDLAANTDGTDTVAEHTADELTGLNAGWNFHPRGSTDTPYRSGAALLPTLRRALAEVPAGRLLFLDLKQANPEPLVQAVLAVLRETRRTANTVVYSTDAVASGAARAAGDVQVAEDRDLTRERLLEIALAHHCDAPPAAGTWMAFEDRRTVAVSETFTSGTATTEVEVTPWDRESVACLDPKDRVNLMVIGVTGAERYRELGRLGIDAVLVDSPRDAVAWRDGRSR
ncbi:glycerophosphodiester phosphodiesterase family protein [Microbacterium sp. NPDC055502]